MVDINGYRDSGMADINSVKILEGSIINANGYNSDLKENYFHCVEFCDGIFGSDIYSDFEPLARYNEIEVIGHCSEYADQIDDPEFKWSGNLGAAIKTKADIVKIPTHDELLGDIKSLKVKLIYVQDYQNASLMRDMEKEYLNKVD